MPSPHDALFRATFDKPENAAAELRRVLPAELVANIDFTTLRTLPSHFVDDELEQCESDLLLAVDLIGGELLIYVLVEHQSSVDGWMPFRRQRTRNNADLPRELGLWTAIAAQLADDALRLVMSYILNVTDAASGPIRDWAHRVSLQAEEAYVTAAEKIAQEARAKALVEGRVEGRREVLSKLLVRRFGELPESARRSLSSASVEQLDDWALRMIDAATLEEVFTP